MIQEEIRLTPIANGSVLDHLPVGTALKIVEILKPSPNNAMSLAINTESKRLGKKDLVMMENRFLTKSEIEKIGLIAKNATLNTIKERQVTEKKVLGIPQHVVEVLKCINPNCITNIEGVETKFSISESPLKAKCDYCEKTMSDSEIAKAIK